MIDLLGNYMAGDQYAALQEAREKVNQALVLLAEVDADLTEKLGAIYRPTAEARTAVQRAQQRIVEELRER